MERTTRHVKRLGVRAWLRMQYGVQLKFSGDEEEIVDIDRVSYANLFFSFFLH